MSSVTKTAMLEAVTVQRRELDRRRDEAVKNLRAEFDAELRELDGVVAFLEKNGDGRTATESTAARESRLARPAAPRRRRRKRLSPVATAKKNREAVLHFAEERGTPFATGEVRRELRLSQDQASRALATLVKEGRLTRTGRGSGTRYLAAKGVVVPLSSPQGRILTLVTDRGWATAEELAQTLRLSVDQVERECGALIAEGELCMSRREHVPVYVLPPAKAA